jgi:hypothetical protein
VTLFLDRQSRARRVNFKGFTTAVELSQPNHDCTLDNTQRRAFIAQGNDAHYRAGRQTDKVAGIELYFDPAVLAGSNSVAFDDWVVQPDELPLLAAVTLQVYLADHQADTDDAGLDVVVVRLVVVLGAGGDSYGEKG